MPRIDRTSVVFTVDGKEWLAKFSHTHNEAGFLHHVGGGNMLHIKHLTACKLSYRDQVGTFLQGSAPCGMRDKYDWKMGLKLALLRALEKGGFCKLHKHACVTCYHDRAKHDELLHGLTPKHQRFHPYREGEIIAEPLKDTFGRIMASFYRELQIKDYWPHRASSSGVDEVSKTLPPILATLKPDVVITGVSAAPEYTQYTGKMHGLGFTGD